MGRARLLLHGRVTAPGGGGGGVPVLSSGPYFVANPLDTATPVPTVIVGQRQFIAANYSNSPTSIDWAIYDNATNDLIDSDTGMVASGDDYWTPGDELAGVIARLETIAHNGTGASVTSSSTKIIQAIDLSLAAPVLTRTSASAASPFTVTQGAFASSVYDGYLEQRVKATSNTVDPVTGAFVDANVVYDESVFLDASTVAAPNTVAWPSFDDSGYPQLYEMRRIMPNPPYGVGIFSPWSNMVQKSDVLTNLTAYAKYRVHTTLTGSGFYTLIADLQIAATPGGADTANNAGVTHTASNSAGGAVANAFDKISGAPNFSTYWATDFAGVAYPHDLIADYSAGTPIAANQFKISSATSGGASGAPRDFTIDGWNGSSWVVLKTLTGILWTDGETKTYVL